MHRFLAGVSLALVAALTPVQAAYLDPEVRADAGGNIGNSGSGEVNQGTGNAVVEATGAYTYPLNPTSSGNLSAAARAAVGQLGVTAQIAVSNVPTSPFTSLAYDAEALARAQFVDEWTFTGRPFDSLGTLRLTSRFDGSAGATAQGSTTVAVALARYSLDVTGLEEFNNIVDFDTYNSGQVQFADETIVFETNFRYGRPVLVRGDLFTSVRFIGTTDRAFISGEGFSLFGNTASLTALEVRGDDGVYSNDFTFETASGGLYPFQAPIPEPSTLAMLSLGGIVLLGVVRRRRGN